MTIIERINALVELQNTWRTQLTNRISTLANAVGTLTDHLKDRDNPHRVTKSHVGLGKVRNYPISTRDQAIAGKDSNSYLTPQRGKELVDKQLEDFEESVNKPVVESAVGIGAHAWLAYTPPDGGNPVVNPGMIVSGSTLSWGSSSSDREDWPVIPEDSTWRGQSRDYYHNPDGFSSIKGLFVRIT